MTPEEPKACEVRTRGSTVTNPQAHRRMGLVRDFPTGDLARRFDRIPDRSQNRTPRGLESRHLPGDMGADLGFYLVELRGFEPLTPSMPWRCATNCATAPLPPGPS